MYLGLHVKYPCSCHIIITIYFSPQFFEKSSNIKFHENMPSRSRTVAWGQTDGWTSRDDDANSRLS